MPLRYGTAVQQGHQYARRPRPPGTAACLRRNSPTRSIRYVTHQKRRTMKYASTRRTPASPEIPSKKVGSGALKARTMRGWRAQSSSAAVSGSGVASGAGRKSADVDSVRKSSFVNDTNAALLNVDALSVRRQLQPAALLPCVNGRSRDATTPRERGLQFKYFSHFQLHLSHISSTQHVGLAPTTRCRSTGALEKFLCVIDHSRAAEASFSSDANSSRPPANSSFISKNAERRSWLSIYQFVMHAPVASSRSSDLRTGVDGEPGPPQERIRSRSGYRVDQALALISDRD